MGTYLAHQWLPVFLPNLPWVEKIVRPVAVYFFLLAAFRISGKRELSQATLFDLLILLLISNVVQNAMIGEDNSVGGAAIGVVTLLLLSFVLNRLTTRSRRARKILEGAPTLLVYRGHIIDQSMKKENVSRNDLLTALREQGVASITEVRYAVLELDGQISVIKNDAQAPAGREECVTAEILEQAPISAEELYLTNGGDGVAPARPTAGTRT